jgi:hypothetical protein
MDEQAAFEQWFQAASPSGDCEAVHKQWMNSLARTQFLDTSNQSLNFGASSPQEACAQAAERVAQAAEAS